MEAEGRIGRATGKEQVSVIEGKRIIDVEMPLSVDKETAMQSDKSTQKALPKQEQVLWPLGHLPRKAAWAGHRSTSAPVVSVAWEADAGRADGDYIQESESGLENTIS